MWGNQGRTRAARAVFRQQAIAIPALAIMFFNLET
jgi:hypothetical protein